VYKRQEYGAVDYIFKPYHYQLLYSRVKTHVDLRLKTKLLESENIHDYMTGILNRNGWSKKTTPRLLHANRQCIPIAVAFFDIDWFKKYNDEYGLDAGDDVIVKIAHCMVDVLSYDPLNVVARIGGEEFVSIILDVTPEGLAKLMQQVHDKLDAMNIPHSKSHFEKVTLSIGTVYLDSVGQNTNISNLMKEADLQLYRSKNTGRNKTSTIRL